MSFINLNRRGFRSMNRKELIDALAIKTDSSKADADRAVSALIEIISGTLKRENLFHLWALVLSRCTRVEPEFQHLAASIP